MFSCQKRKQSLLNLQYVTSKLGILVKIFWELSVLKRVTLLYYKGIPMWSPPNTSVIIILVIAMQY